MTYGSSLCGAYDEQQGVCEQAMRNRKFLDLIKTCYQDQKTRLLNELFSELDVGMAFATFRNESKGNMFLNQFFYSKI